MNDVAPNRGQDKNYLPQPEARNRNEACEAFGILTSEHACELARQRVGAALLEAGELNSRINRIAQRQREAAADMLLPGEERSQRIESMGEEIRHMYEYGQLVVPRLRTAQVIHENRARAACYLATDRSVETLKGMLGVAIDQSEQRFVDEKTFTADIDYAAGELYILAGDEEDAIEIPTANLVSAASFASWEQGRPKHNSKHTEGSPEANTSQEADSEQVMRQYALEPTEIPPLDEVWGVIHPDGSISYLVKAGAHRAGAAKMKGQKTVKAETVVLFREEAA